MARRLACHKAVYKVEGFCCPAPSGPRLQLGLTYYQLGSDASHYDVVVSCNKCNVVVGI